MNKPKTVKVYTTPTCVFCHALMEWLDEQGITYEEHSASEDPTISAVPVTIIDGQRIVGFDRPAIKEALGL
jgi:glutaredoxin